MESRTEDKEVVVVSACLLGLPTRYDGASKEKIILEKEKAIFVPVCPEQLGGLSTPRPAAQIVNGDGFDVIADCAKVINREGADVSANFIKGAEIVLEIAQSLNCSKVYLKSKSPSCAVSGKIGVAAALLKDAGFDLVEL